jgi:hypothetical protein
MNNLITSHNIANNLIKMTCKKNDGMAGMAVLRGVKRGSGDDWYNAYIKVLGALEGER